MNRRTLLQAIAASPLMSMPALAAQTETWRELARREVRPSAGLLFVALPGDAPPMRRIKLAAHGCGLWIYGVEGFGAWGAAETIQLNLHVPPGWMSLALEFKAPVFSLRLSLDALPFGDGPIEAAVWGAMGAVTPLSGPAAITRVMEMRS